MSDLKQYTLDKIIDIHSLQNIQDKFSKMTNLSAVTVDRLGTPITAPSSFTKFCRLIRTSMVGYSRCIDCDAKGGIKSIQLKKPVIYTCHAGLTDLSAPIIVNDTYLGCMICGQVVMKDDKSKDSSHLKKLSDELDIPLEKLEATFKEVKVMKYKKIIDAADFLSLFASLIAKMGIATITHFDLLTETKEKMKYQQLAKDSQIKSLQSKINPHFLFNTLNTIAGMALMENSDNTAKLIYSLSDMLRYSLRNSENMVEIGAELESIQKYLFIQTMRYSDKISYDIKIPDEILKYKIPAMTLQPLIENAVIHGLEPKNGPGKISITGQVISNKHVIIKITDNGVGMDSEKLNMITNKANPSSNDSIGMRIVQDRLVYYFGSEFSMKIDSTPFVGTTVCVKVPIVY